MVKFKNLRLMEIKEELAKRKYKNIGCKSDLLMVLERVLIDEGIDLENYDFQKQIQKQSKMNVNVTNNEKCDILKTNINSNTNLKAIRNNHCISFNQRETNNTNIIKTNLSEYIYDYFMRHSYLNELMEYNSFFTTQLIDTNSTLKIDFKTTNMSNYKKNKDNINVLASTPFIHNNCACYDEPKLTYKENYCDKKATDVNLIENSITLSELKSEIQDLKLMVEKLSNNYADIKNENVYLKSVISELKDEQNNYTNAFSHLTEVTKHFVGYE